MGSQQVGWIEMVKAEDLQRLKLKGLIHAVSERALGNHTSERLILNLRFTVDVER